MSADQFVHYLPGGGLGDVYREAYFFNALGVLKRWKVLHPTAHLTVVTLSHNPGAADLLEGCDWIDAHRPLRFDTLHMKDWDACYTQYPECFAGQTELRWYVADRRSLYRADLAELRPRHGTLGPVQVIPGIGMQWDMCPASERDHLEYDRGRVVLHPYAGEATRAWSRADTLFVRGLLPAHGVALTIGASYDRPGHGPEEGRTFVARDLIHVVEHARAVVATESSVYYLASMLGVPTAMLYTPGETFDRVQRGESDWNWYFNTDDPRSLFLPTPLSDADRVRLTAWMAERLA